MLSKVENQCWLEGIRAFEAKLPRTSNPYVNSITKVSESVSWFGGWDVAAIIILDGAKE